MGLLNVAQPKDTRESEGGGKEDKNGKEGTTDQQEWAGSERDPVEEDTERSDRRGPTANGPTDNGPPVRRSARPTENGPPVRPSARPTVRPSDRKRSDRKRSDRQGSDGDHNGPPVAVRPRWHAQKRGQPEKRKHNRTPTASV